MRGTRRKPNSKCAVKEFEAGKKKKERKIVENLVGRGSLKESCVYSINIVYVVYSIRLHIVYILYSALNSFQYSFSPPLYTSTPCQLALIKLHTAVCLSRVIDYASCSLSPRVRRNFFKQGSLLLRPCTGHSQAPEKSACVPCGNATELRIDCVFRALRIRRVVHQLRVKDVSKCSI